MCISSRGKVYSWKFLDDNKNCTFNVGSFANGVNICSRYAAVACDNGKTYVWDLLLGKMIFEKEIMDAPVDVAFTKDGKQLWVISGYNCVNTIDLESKVVKSVYVEDPETGPPHPWNAYLFMTADGNYCISRCYYGDRYILFDKHGNIIKTGTCFDDYIKEHPNDILAEFVSPEEFDFDPESLDTRNPELTARRISPDGEMCIEGYSNGIIKIASLKEREIIESLIGNKTKAL
jgi:WD40 repeat protein